MRTCPYCGAEFGDEAETCTIDGHILVASVARPPVVKPPPASPRRRLRKIPVLAVAALGAVVFLAANIPSVPTANVALAFVGYSNDASGNRLALFEMSNGGAMKIERLGLYDRFVRPSPEPPASAVRLDWNTEKRDQPVGLSDGRNVFGTSKILDPGQSERITVFVTSQSATTNPRPWRIGIPWTPSGWRRHMSHFINRHPWLRRHAPQRWQGTRGEWAVSEWIENEKLGTQ